MCKVFIVLLCTFMVTLNAKVSNSVLTESKTDMGRTDLRILRYMVNLKKFDATIRHYHMFCSASLLSTSFFITLRLYAKKIAEAYTDEGVNRYPGYHVKIVDRKSSHRGHILDIKKVYLLNGDTKKSPPNLGIIETVKSAKLPIEQLELMPPSFNMKAYTQGIGAYGSDPITVLNKTYNYKVLFEIISLKIITNMEKLEVNEYWLDEICTVKFLEDIEFYRPEIGAPLVRDGKLIGISSIILSYKDNRRPKFMYQSVYKHKEEIQNIMVQSCKSSSARRQKKTQ